MINTNIPDNVTSAISKLSETDQEVVVSYIRSLQGVEEEEEEEDKGDDDLPEGATVSARDTDFPPMYTSSGEEDFDKMSEAKMEASDLKSSGDYAGALEKYSEAVQLAPPSALLYASRAECLLKLQRPCAAIRDCDEAIKSNPDSAKALRIRGRAKRALGDWEGARKDLSQSQQIDFDDTAMEDLKFVTEKVSEKNAKVTKARLEEEEKKRKKAADIKKAREEREAQEAKEKAERSMPGGMPGMGGGIPGMGGGMPGMGGGMPGMGGGMPGMDGMMQMLMSDPELAAGLQNPKVISAFSEMMSGGGMPNPAKIQGLMADPEVGPFLKKFMSKIGGSMGGGMPGMGGGIPGMGGSAANNDDDDFDDMPDLE